VDTDGYVFIMGRADDYFKSKGVLIAPREVEEAILGLGAFEEARVFPIADDVIGNRIAAAVATGEGVSRLIRRASPAHLRAISRLSSCPHLVHVLAEGPRTPTARRNAARSHASFSGRSH
jgi:acyl-coenzyme A synthetase/AMP-(fatty) acid ligase